jgi:hypothetical protein
MTNEQKLITSHVTATWAKEQLRILDEMLTDRIDAP